MGSYISVSMSQEFGEKEQFKKEQKQKWKKKKEEERNFITVTTFLNACFLNHLLIEFIHRCSFDPHN